MKDQGPAVMDPTPAAVRSTPLPGARAALILLLAINLFNYIDRQVLAAVVPKIRERFFQADAPASVATVLMDWLQAAFGFNPENALIGSLAMAFMVTYMLAAPLFGWLAERRSRWALVSAGVIVWSLASGGSGLAVTFGMLFLTRCLVGIGEAAYGPVAPTMISDLYPVKVRGSVLAWFYMAIPVGSALGYVLGGAVSDINPEKESWRWAFFLVVPPGLLLGMLCLLMKEPPRGQADLVGDASFRQTRRRNYGILLRTPSYVLNTLGMTAMTFALGGIAFWMPDFIYHYGYNGEANLSTINLTFGVIVVVAGLAATLLGGIVGDKLRPRYPGSYFLVSGVAMLLGFPLSVAMIYAPFPAAWGLVFLACFCLFFNTGPTNTILANVTHPAMRATGFALNILVIHALGDVISPLVIGMLTDKFKNMRLAFLIVSGMILAAGVLWLWGARYLQRDTELAPHRLDEKELD